MPLALGADGVVQWRMADAYDLLPYTEHAYAESSPDHLRVVALLSGFVPSSSLTPRVLELGCGRGGNLLPLAATWPDTTFVGIDRSAVQTRDATRIAEAAGLRNVTFVTADFTADDPPREPYDFVVCHGVYSWVPVATRARLMDRIARSLGPRGLAYVSFNTLPGWYGRLAARDFLRFSARSALAEGPRQALDWLTTHVSLEEGSYRDTLGAVQRRLTETDAAYLTHEYLSEEHHPVHVATFLDEASASGLSYLGDALPLETAFELLPDEVRARAAQLDPRDALTLVDFVRNTAFRRAILVRSDTARASGFDAPRVHDARALTGLRIASRLVPQPRPEDLASTMQSFVGPAGSVVLSGLARSALLALADVAPRSLAVGDLARTLSVPEVSLAAELHDLWLAVPGLDLHLAEPAFVTALSERPTASPVARWHAIEGGPVTNAWHQEVDLPDAAVRFVLGCLDGRTRAEDIAEHLRVRANGKVTVDEALSVVRASLAVLGQAALLVA